MCGYISYNEAFMITVICWLVIHTKVPDNREYLQFRGQIIKEYDDSFKVNFYDAFKAKKVDTRYNPTVQLVQGNECLYDEK